MKPGRLCACYRFVLRTIWFFFFRYPATLCWRLDLPVLWKPLCVFILWLRLIGRTWLFIYLHCCKLGPSHTQKNHLLCTYIAFCRQINIVLTGEKKLNPNLNSDSEFWMIQLLRNLSGFFFKNLFPYNVYMRKYVLNSKWGILSLPILPRLLPNQDWKPNIGWILACTTLVQKHSF